MLPFSESRKQLSPWLSSNAHSPLAHPVAIAATVFVPAEYYVIIRDDARSAVADLGTISVVIDSTRYGV